MHARTLSTLIAATVLIVGTSSLAVAQMGGMGMPMPAPTPSPATTPATHTGSGTKAAEIGALGGAAGAGLLYWRLHNRATLTGCVGGDGDTLVSENDGRTYTLTSENVVLRPGERVELKGKKREHGTELEVHKMTQDFGPCRPATAEKK
jgi:hypothetical protein